MGKLGPLEIVLIFVVILLVFGPSKLPQIGAAIGKGIREFKNVSKEMKSQLEMELDNDSTKESK